MRWFRAIRRTATDRDSTGRESADRTSTGRDSAGSSRPIGAERDPARLIAFSDAVFAIAVTLLILEIRPPQDTRDLLHGLTALWPSYLAYTVTFLLIGQVWVNHRVMFDHVRAADRLVLFLNTLLLMVVAFLPFASSVLAAAFESGHGQRSAVVFYGIAFETAVVLFNITWEYVRRGKRLLRQSIDTAGANAIGRRYRLALVWIAVGTAVGALHPVAGVLVIAAFIPAYWLPIGGEVAAVRRVRDRGPAPP
ncbi:TMEM175 family protein [Plantactinospora soyae]|uniref:Membrane protein n=1 Tax=Plantactinospora soyae TaxID=1544732 RepID=A0A927R360_9ACTN|nr:TMEM175 family protein [Plantactinospora soyae]MBE1491503.1 putative membrane protein [Plantactinospora soyae]